MTVSWPDTFGAVSSRWRCAPKSCVTVSSVPAGAVPAPAPHPATGAASAPRSATSAAGRIDRVRSDLPNVEDTAVAAPLPDGVAVQGLVDRLHVEHVVAAPQPLRQQEREVAAVAHREEEPAPAPGADEAVAPAAEREAALVDAAGPTPLHRADPPTGLGDGRVDEPRRE